MVTRIRNAALALLVAASALVPASPGRALGAGSALTVIVISLDGTTPADLRAAQPPVLGALARRGASAERLAPVFPTNTFPNHVSLVTGVTPAVHGIVNNVFLDPKRGLYRYSNDPTWIEVEPLWSIADRHGIVSAAYHWIGSEGPWRNGRGPRHWRAFDAATPESAKVEQILAWLELEPDEARPRLITSWFHGADAAAHRFGPGSKEAHADLLSQDRALGRLVAALDASGAFETAILLVVSDHGMAPVDRSVDVTAALDAAGVKAAVYGGGGIATLSVPGGPGDVAEATARLRSLGLEVLVPGDAAADRTLANPRFGDLVALAPPGTAIAGRSGSPMRGAHGYPPDAPGMGGLLIAAGAGIRPGTRIGEVRTLDVAPTVLAWLGISPPAWMEGRPIAALAPPAASSRGGSEAAPDMGEGR